MQTVANTRISEYFKARKPEFHVFGNGTSRTYQATAQSVLRSIKVRAQWHVWECDDDGRNAECGSVRLRVVPDDCNSYDDLEGDTFNPDVNDDIPRARLEREQKEFRKKVDREGVWGVIGEYFDGAEWKHADSCFGFVGDDWKESGYDIDIMRATLHASESCRAVRENRAPYPSTWKSPIGYLVASETGYRVAGLCCKENYTLEREVPVYYANIGPLYSQHCFVCGRELIHGTSGVELFDGKA